MLSMMRLRLAVGASFLQLFQKFIQSPQSPIRKFRIFCLINLTFNNVRFHQNSIFVTKTHVNTEPLATDDGLMTSVLTKIQSEYR